jgi:nucleoside 2-deoxyribosyltransferase
MLKIDKYCPFTDRKCNGEIEYKGKKSSFFAYPFQHDWPEIMNVISQGLISRGFIVELPGDIVQSGVIACKLCKMILSSNMIISEVTEPNRNVMFELGYAMGLGKEGLILVNKSSKYESLRSRYKPLKLLNDLEQIHYEDSNDLIEKISNWKHRYSEDTSIRPPSFFECRTCKLTEDEDI